MDARYLLALGIFFATGVALAFIQDRWSTAHAPASGSSSSRPRNDRAAEEGETASRMSVACSLRSSSSHRTSLELPTQPESPSTEPGGRRG
jgi:hypothetical protein